MKKTKFKKNRIFKDRILNNLINGSKNHKIYEHVIFCLKDSGSIDNCDCKKSVFENIDGKVYQKAIEFKRLLSEWKLKPLFSEFPIEKEKGRNSKKIDLLVMNESKELMIFDLKTGENCRYVNRLHRQNISQMKGYIKIWNNNEKTKKMGEVKCGYLYYQDADIKDNLYKVEFKKRK